MRKEHEVINQILNYARYDDRVRAVILNGSRVNPNAAKDIFCDYDIIYAVTDPEAFLHNQDWIKSFGELIIMQQNEIEEKGEKWYIFLMLFTDGVRIDLSFRKAINIKNCLDDSLTQVILDKDNIIGQLEPANESSYFTKRPTKQEFEKNINNLLWCSTNAAKGLWREELSYAKFMLDVIVRDCLINILAWHIGFHNNWSVNVGKAGKWLRKYLPADIWESFTRTFAGAEYDEIWNSIFETCKLTRRIGMNLAQELGYEYPIEDDKKVMEYLEKVRYLPKDATSLK